MYSKIVATGAYLPEKSVTNDDLANTIDTSHEWIVERTGIESRHIANEEETVVVMGQRAAQQALDRAGWSADDIDMVVVATCTPDKTFPSTACLIQQALGIPPCGAFDVQAVCSGFIYGLSVVDQFIRNGKAKRVLLVGVEKMSKVLDWQDRSTCILFGDGAGAVLLEASETPGILDTQLSADGNHKEVLFLDKEPESTVQMQGNALFKLAVNLLDKAAVSMLEANQLEGSQIDWFIPHQANVRIIKATAEKLGLPMEKVILTLAKQGNTSAASIPLALDSGIQSGQLKRGQLLLLEAIGGGLTWGTALVRY